MNYDEAREIIACLGRDRTLFHYFKDRYACLLLAEQVGEGRPIREVRNLPFGRLLNRPVVRSVVRESGDGLLRADDLLSIWPEQRECYLLTLGIWGPRKSAQWSRGLNVSVAAGVCLFEARRQRGQAGRK